MPILIPKTSSYPHQGLPRRDLWCQQWARTWRTRSSCIEALSFRPSPGRQGTHDPQHSGCSLWKPASWNERRQKQEGVLRIENLHEESSLSASCMVSQRITTSVSCCRPFPVQLVNCVSGIRVAPTEMVELVDLCLIFNNQNWKSWRNFTRTHHPQKHSLLDQ